jgi:phage terminase small subunit
MGAKLTDKQKAFCHYYIIDWNATKAAIKAGYSEKTAQQISSENLLKPVIQDYIKEIQNDIAKEAGISMLSQVLELKKIAYTDISTMFKDWVTLEDFESLTTEQKGAFLEISYKKDIRKVDEDTDIETEFVKLKLHDKIRAIQEINKMLGYSIENIDIKTGGEKIKETTVTFVNARKN